ncbi:MAG: long-chain fatty acid--CoA ligase, partial [Acidimicrobiia bacterium]|nr:long-chain fatty acid--CoA ligase [Acidimicrobiia bacterium]
MTQEAVLTERAEIDAVIEGKTIVDYFNRNADRHGDKPAIHWKDNGAFRELTWSGYRDLVHQAAAGLAALGV